MPFKLDTANDGILAFGISIQNCFNGVLEETKSEISMCSKLI